MKVRAHIFVSGKVQGVFFRVTTRREAMKRNVTGWVRNTKDNRVEAIFEGEEENVEKLIDFCRSGPPAALVREIDIQWEEPFGHFPDFEIRTTTYT